MQSTPSLPWIDAHTSDLMSCHINTSRGPALFLTICCIPSGLGYLGSMRSHAIGWKGNIWFTMLIGLQHMVVDQFIPCTEADQLGFFLWSNTAWLVLCKAWACIDHHWRQRFSVTGFFQVMLIQLRFSDQSWLDSGNFFPHQDCKVCRSCL